MNKNVWFVLGRDPLISTAEIVAFFGIKHFSPTTNSILKIPSSNISHVEPSEIIKKLGGTIKIGVELATDLTEDALIETIMNELQTVEGKIHFGLSVYSSASLRGGQSRRPPASTSKASRAGGNLTTFQHQLGDYDASLVMTLKKWGLFIKKTMQQSGRSVRYVANKDMVLSSVTVEKNGLTKRGKEFLIQKTGTTYAVAITQAVQPFEAWGARDFGRPGRDDKSGMLPPKLATIMINLSGIKVGVNLPECVQAGGRSPLLLDPFCGSGTILTEALELGFSFLIGTDASEKAVFDTQKNIQWTLSQKNLSEPKSIKVFQSDVEHLEENWKNSGFLPTSVDYIVSEPYMGKPLHGGETKAELEKQTEILKKIYTDAFKQFHKLLKPAGKIVFIIPRFKCKHEWVRIDCLEEIKKSGFKTTPLLPTHDFLLYARPNQFVGRELWRFEKI